MTSEEMRKQWILARTEKIVMNSSLLKPTPCLTHHSTPKQKELEPSSSTSVST